MFTQPICLVQYGLQQVRTNSLILVVGQKMLHKIPNILSSFKFIWLHKLAYY